MKLTANFYGIALLLLMSLTACDTKEEKGYSKETINSTKLCPQVTYACLSETKDKHWEKTLLATEVELSVSELFFIREKVIEKVFEHYKVDKGINEDGKDALNQLFDIVHFNKESSTPGRAYYLNGGHTKQADLALSIAADFMNKTEEELRLMNSQRKKSKSLVLVGSVR